MKEVLPCRLAASTALAGRLARAGLCHTSTIVLPRQAANELAYVPSTGPARIAMGGS